MNKIDILRYVWKLYRKHFRQYNQRKICADFGLVLGKSETSPYIGKPAFSKFLTDSSKTITDSSKTINVIYPSEDRENEPLEKYLERFLRENPEKREEIAEKISNPMLFYCRTFVEVDQFFPQPTEDDPAIPIPKEDFIRLPFGTPPTNERVLNSEAEATKLLAEHLLQGTEGVMHWEVLPWSGGTFVACNLVLSEDLASLFETMLVIRPTSRASPFESQLIKVANTLSIDTQTVAREDLPRKIAVELFTQKVLLVIADAHHIPSSGMDGGLVSDLLKMVCTVHSGEPATPKPSHVFLVGKNRRIDWLENKISSAMISPSIPLGSKAFSEFRKLWESYRKARDTSRFDLGGPRLKRAKAMYENLGGTKKSISPSEIRLHAFFASDPFNYAYADPSAGMLKPTLNGKDQPPFTIRLMYDDVIGYLRSVWPKDESARETSLRSLRYCSTTKHWLSSHVFDHLSKEYRDTATDKLIVSMLTSEAFQGWVIANRQLFSQRSISGFDNNNIQVFELPNFVKALVQDQWRQHQPVDRAIAHWRVAEYLFNFRNDKGRLQEEFPYAPHWGRSRFFFLGECIRHLIRSCETQAIGQIMEGVSLDDFPAQPESGASGTVPETVLDYCYANLFQRQLNGNASFGSTGQMDTTSRVMSKRHGAGKYATELLQLMSHNGEIGVPHPALRHEFHPSFIKECGYATLDLGELETADRCFSRLTGPEWEPSVRISAMLDKALVKSEMMELDTARALIEKAEKLAKSEDLHTDQIKGRIKSRRAFLDFLDKNFDGALSKLNKLLTDDISKADTEQLHLKIAALSAKQDNLQEPMSLCFAALFRETSAGHHHEALGFRIALARILREQGSLVPAEHVLLSVQNDIYQFGCSERTYLSFLREAGRNLVDQGKPIRAYLAYLRPCLLRAHDRKFGRFVETTSGLVQETLAVIKTARSTQSDDEWNSCIDQCVMDEKTHQKNSRRIIQAVANLDPLFGYYSEDIESEIESFRKEGAINVEIETINKLINL